jgi:hypothetical protein
MKCFGLLAVLLFQLVSLGALAVELDEITLDVIDARANSVDDVMRNIEIPRYERKTVRASEPLHPSAIVQAGHGAEHDEDHREGAESSHHEDHEDAHEAHEEAVEDVEETHQEAVEDIEESREDAIEDVEESHEDSVKDIENVELPEKPEDIEEHERTEGSGESD